MSQEVLEYAGLKFIHLDTALPPLIYCTIFFVVLFFTSRFVFSYLLFTKTYNALSFRKKLDWDCRINSTINAIVGVYYMVYTYLYLPEAFDDFFNFWNPVFTYSLSFTCGYFIQDIVIVIYEFDVPMLIHHAMGVTGLFLSTSTGLAGPVLIVYLGTEITTPFLNARWFLSELGYKETTLYLLNGLTGTVLWLIFRIGVIPYFYYKLYFLWDHFLEHTPMAMVVICLLYATILNLLNSFWFYKIMSGLMKILKGDKKKEKKDK
eukprot:gene7995-12460_t